MCGNLAKVLLLCCVRLPALDLLQAFACCSPVAAVWHAQVIVCLCLPACALAKSNTSAVCSQTGPSAYYKHTWSVGKGYSCVGLPFVVSAAVTVAPPCLPCWPGTVIFQANAASQGCVHDAIIRCTIYA